MTLGCNDCATVGACCTTCTATAITAALAVAAAAMVAAAATAPAVAATAAVIPATQPRIGGVKTVQKESITWTSGGIRTTQTTQIAAPVSMKAFRPDDYKSQTKMEDACTKGLPAAQHLSTPDKLTSDSNIVGLGKWIEVVQVELKERGMDSVFRVLDAQGAETYLLAQYRSAEVPVVKTWVQSLQAGTVGTGGVCAYDLANLKMSGKFLRQSLDVDMLKKLQGDVKPDATGPEVFAAAVNIHQRLSSCGVRTLMKKLQALKLAKEPGENVETFATKVLEIAKLIKGTGPENCPKDLVVLAYEPFLGSSTPTFNMR
jgi:hypothetical protein